MGIVARQSIKGTIATYVGVAVGIVTTFFVQTKYLTTEEIGLVDVLLQSALLFSGLAQLGTNTSAMRITTGLLNDLLANATARVQPPTDKGKRLKIYYMTQTSVKPPTFIFFCNNAELFHFSYQRYLENRLREAFDFSGTPIRFIIRERNNK